MKMPALLWLLLGVVHADHDIVVTTKPTFDANMSKTGGKQPRCPLSVEVMNGGKKSYCPQRVVPMAYNLGGGQCQALLQHSGWFRAGVLNPAVFEMGQTDREWGAHPLITATAAAGSAMYARMMALQDYPSSDSFKYPCYRLGGRYREICTFHQDFGGLPNVCDAERYNVIKRSILVVYDKIIKQYGGATGVASSYLFSYFTFINDLPLPGVTRYNYAAFTTTFSPFSWLYDTPRTWIPGITRVSPVEAMPYAPYNFGFSSWLTRGYDGYAPSTYKCSTGDSEHGRCEVAWCASCGYYSNYSLGMVVGHSAMNMPAAPYFSFGLAGKNWDPVNGYASQATQTKVMGMLLSYVMTRRMLKTHVIEDSPSAPFCKDGCPTFDSSMMDSGPLVPTLSHLTKLPRNIRPTLIFQNVPASSFSTYAFQLGIGPMDFYSGAAMGGNVCPFYEIQWCTGLKTLRELLLKNLPHEDTKDYHDIANAYMVYVPEAKSISAYCGDPMTVDKFMSECRSGSYCHMLVTVMPGRRNAISFTVEPTILYLTSVYIAPTPQSREFLEEFVPASLLALPWFNSMAAWFPSFTLQGGNPERGGKNMGLGFTKAAGNPFMDYMTYLNMRLAMKRFWSKNDAWTIYKSNRNAPCGWMVYEAVSTSGVAEQDFSRVLKGQEVSKDGRERLQ